MTSPDSRTEYTLLQRLLGSRLVTGTGVFLAKYVPPFIGNAIADTISWLVNTFRPQVYWIAYANHRQMMGPHTDGETLHHQIRRVIRINARNNYDFWHKVGWGKDAIRAAVHFPSEAWEYLDQAKRHGKGGIIVGPHTGNFNLGMMALVAYGIETKVLGIAAPPAESYNIMDRLRLGAGLNLKSISVSSLRTAVRELRSGGLVLTGVDRPVSSGEPLVEFFGRPSLLPTGHVRLALKTDAVIVIASAFQDPQGKDGVIISPPIEMIRTGDPEQDLRANLRQVTARLEEFIRARPEQWAMFIPVWPEPDS